MTIARSGSITTPPVSSSLSHVPLWTTLEEDQRKGFHESWTLQVADPSSQRSIWILLNLLSSRNGFRRVVEAWAVVSHRKENREVSKLAVKQSQDLSGFQSLGNDGSNCVIRLNECELGPDYCRGTVQSKGRTVKWDFRFHPARDIQFNFIPDPLSRLKLIPSTWTSTQADLRIDGTTEIDGERHVWNKAPASINHRAGTREWHSWVEGYCNTFVTEQGEPVDFLFEGLSGNVLLPGGFRGPRLSSFLFVYQGKPYRFNGFWDVFRNRSENSFTEWTFEAEQGDMRFRGQVKAEHRDFVGITYEDTDGSLLYNANSKLSQMKVVIYRRGKLDQSLHANGLASFEVVSREKNPYVPVLI